MSIIILTPPPKKSGTTTSDPLTVSGTVSAAAVPADSPVQRLESAFLHLIGLEGHRFDSWEALRDFAAAQCAAVAPAADPAAVAQP